MGKRLPYTPRSKIRNVLRRYVWLRSRERAAALKREKYSCMECKKKQSKAKGKAFKLLCRTSPVMEYLFCYWIICPASNTMNTVFGLFVFIF